MKNISKLILLLLILSLTEISIAQSGTIAQEIRREVWGRRTAEYTNRDTPEKWKGESAVILLQDYRYTFDKQMGNVLTKNSYHTRVVLLDKNAVKEFSEFSFKEKFYGANSFKRGTTYTGFKIVKSDGTEKIVDIAAAVEIASDDARETMKKIAIPDLEEGDIIDYYYYEVEYYALNSSKTYSFSPVLTTLTSGYPIKYLKRQFEVEKKFYINYKPTNGAPDLKSREEDKLRIFTLEMEDLEKTIETDWMYTYRSVPTVKFQVVYAKSQAYANTAPNFLGKAGEIKTSVTEKEVRDMFSKIVAPNYRFDSSKFLKYLENKGLNRSKMDKGKLAEELYFYQQHKVVGSKLEAYFLGRGKDPGVSDYVFVSHMKVAFSYYDIKADVLMVVDRSVNAIEDLVLWQEIGLLIRTQGENPIYMANFSLHPSINMIPVEYEGTEAYAYNLHTKFTNYRTDTLPVSSIEDNKMVFTTEASLDEEKEKVIFHNKYEAQGHNKEWYQYRYMSLYDYQPEEDLKYGEPPYIQTIGKNEKTAVLQEIEEYKKTGKKSVDEGIEDFIKSDYKTEEAEVKNFKVLSTGRFDKPVFAFELDAEVEGLIQQAGPNYLLNAGIFITSQREIEEKDMERTVDIYMPSARSYVNNITFQIPEGYTIEGIEKLRKNVDNETGGFISTAEIEEDKLIINVKKWYASNYEPAENWPKMLEFLEVGYEFTKEKVLLKKK